jgi:hypothetical protein
MADSADYYNTYLHIKQDSIITHALVVFGPAQEIRERRFQKAPVPLAKLDLPAHSM